MILAVAALLKAVTGDSGKGDPHNDAIFLILAVVAKPSAPACPALFFANVLTFDTTGWLGSL